ncbi:MAG: ABC transporter permease [Desulfonauticus sp.]|nr:ABC transporter permease [Desulfonauticus sp.]
MGSIDLNLLSLGFVFVLIGIPLALDLIFKFGLTKNILQSVLRMSVQLLLIGIFLRYLFLWNNPWINVSWFLIMVITSVFSVVKNTPLRLKTIFFPLFLAFVLPTFFLVIYLNFLVLHLKHIFDARYFIILAGMLLGNCLRSNIIALSSVYNQIKSYPKKYLYLLSLGASTYEAILPYLTESVGLAVKPFLATMATMGIVALPGMMTGVILGGASPEIAVKYQIMIMFAILSNGLLAVVLGILFTLKSCFDDFGCLKNQVFKS